LGRPIDRNEIVFSERIYVYDNTDFLRCAKKRPRRMPVEGHETIYAYKHIGRAVDVGYAACRLYNKIFSIRTQFYR